MSFLVLVCGSRGWRDGSRIYDRLVALDKEHDQVTVLQGGAQGADRLARGWAWKLGMGVLTVRPDWRKHGKGAGLKRNEKMADMGPKLVLAYWDGKSNGTRHMIQTARDRGIPVEVYGP